MGRCKRGANGWLYHSSKPAAALGRPLLTELMLPPCPLLPCAVRAPAPPRVSISTSSTNDWHPSQPDALTQQVQQTKPTSMASNKCTAFTSLAKLKTSEDSLPA